MLEGRSSIARLGLFVNASAGIGDIGFRGYWTLELVAVHPIRIYPGLPICQILYMTSEGAISEYRSSDKYQNNQDIQPSLLFKELQSPPKDLQMRLAFGQELAE
jgi:dCTP deaminase